MTPELGFSYLFAHPDTVGISLENPAALALLLLVPILIATARKDFARHRLALIARIAAFALVVLALAELMLSARLPSDRLAVVAVVDRSESIDAEGRKWEESYLRQVAGALAPGDEIGVVAFGARASVVRPPSTAGDIELSSADVAPTATDIANGLETAMALFPPDTERRLLLISDGNETRGSSLGAVARAKRSAVTIFAAVPPHVGGSDAAVEKLAVAPLVAEGSVFPVRVIIRNRGKARSALLALSVDGERAGDEAIRLQPGLNAVEIPYRLFGAGSHRLRAQISAVDDTIAGNNYREAALMVGGKPRALLVSSSRRPTLARILERKDIAVVQSTPRRFPEEIEGLLSYHCIIFEDVAARDFRAGSLAILESYVKDFGGGFIMAGGEATYGDPGFRKTALEQLLPVTLEPRRPPRREREPLALFLLIDRSNSMGYHFRNRLERSESESKLVYARRAAHAVVNQLKDNDMVGVIAFDSQPFEVAALRRLGENREQLDRDIPRLQPGGGTDFYDALESARQQLIDARVGTKHVILLTDGDTNRGAADHYPLIAGLTKADISVTTIRIGDDTVNLTLLNDISSRTGGQFYHVENAETLPELLLKDTSQALAQAPQRDETFAPQLAGINQVLRGIDPKALRDLHGYAYARPKRAAELLMYVAARDRKDPILAAWQYGLGRVVAFTASPRDDAERWMGWDGLGKFWSQTLRWTVREQTPLDYAVDVRRSGGETTLTVRTFGDITDGVLIARLLVDPDRPIDVSLAPRAPREFSARLTPLPAGRYPLLITRRDNDRDVSQRTALVLVPDRDEEPQEEYLADGPNVGLLRALAEGTGGSVNAPVRTIVGRKVGQRRMDRRLDWILIPLAMLLFLADVGLRRFGSARQPWGSRPPFASRPTP